MTRYACLMLDVMGKRPVWLEKTSLVMLWMTMKTRLVRPLSMWTGRASSLMSKLLASETSCWRS
jgi:hypothetical protein